MERGTVPVYPMLQHCYMLIMPELTYWVKAVDQHASRTSKKIGTLIENLKKEKGKAEMRKGTSKLEAVQACF